MPATLRRDFHRAAFTNLSVFIKFFDRLAKTPEMRRIFDTAPDIVTNGRTMTQIAIDDLMSAFAFMMRKVPDDQIPLSFYKQLLVARDNMPATNDEARARLNEALAEKRALPDDADNTAPELVPLFTEHVPEMVARHMLANYVNMLTNIRQLTFTEEAFATTHEAKKIITQTGVLFDTIIGRITQRNNVASRMENSADDDADEEDDVGEDSLEDLITRVKAAKMTGPAKEKAYKELRKLKRMNKSSAEFTVVFNYLDLMASLPWEKAPEIARDIASARTVLEADHHGLKKVKDAILEFIAVQNHTGKPNGQILCIDGPPGTGKTSITQSIARALGRKYVRLSLGGVDDEAEIRGHRTTYIGALPGRVIQAMKTAGVTNPLINLDEVDKMGQNTHRGDPTAALLEVLDPAQNHTFRDHYLGIDYDLSNVMFVCTSNYLDRIPPALRDRMEIIHIGGYTKDEKFEIAKRHLVAKQMAQSGLTAKQFTLDDDALKNIINDYTAEAGVRRLENMIKRVCRKAVMAIEEKRVKSVHVTAQNLPDLIGPSRGRKQSIAPDDRVGLVNGLAYTSVGGCTLPIEAVAMDGNGFRVTATGRLGETMRESVEYAQKMIRSRAKQFGLDPDKLNRTEVHLHAPEAAIPKDGPSAGIAISTAILSVLTGKKIRHDIAMTGEVTLHGDVGAIGGLPEKLEGAVEAGVKTVLIPQDNEKDLIDVPESIKSKLTIIPVSRIEKVFEYALVDPPALSADPSPDEVLRVFNWMAKNAGNDNRFTDVIKHLKANGSGTPQPT